MSCAVKNYKNAKIFRPEGIHFHGYVPTFPKGQLLHLWKSALGLDENWQRSANKYVCSKHFKDNDYLIIDNRAVLKQNAVPFIILQLLSGLNIPSDGVVKICNTAEIFIKRMLLITDKPIAQQYYDKIDVPFPPFKDHFFATAIVEENHGYALIKAIRPEDGHLLGPKLVVSILVKF
ncbi:hypothetical protein NQ317_007973 [Molorchus minor]|uniref:THAP-type domain-containing protein n=1 Tax=Molorchus minor TaxID=1323400 RepID=A0ABQ9JM56_9CUCU|nr:hypothetical protein NQ317_007973 [Molorchus minor]